MLVSRPVKWLAVMMTIFLVWFIHLGTSANRSQTDDSAPGSHAGALHQAPSPIGIFTLAAPVGRRILKGTAANPPRHNFDREQPHPTKPMFREIITLRAPDVRPSRGKENARGGAGR